MADRMCTIQSPVHFFFFATFITYKGFQDHHSIYTFFTYFMKKGNQVDVSMEPCQLKPMQNVFLLILKIFYIKIIHNCHCVFTSRILCSLKHLKLSLSLFITTQHSRPYYSSFTDQSVKFKRIHTANKQQNFDPMV